MNGFLDTVLFPLEWFVATIMVGFHTALESIGLPAASGWTWALSIVGLVVVLRILLIPLSRRSTRGRPIPTPVRP
jgi:YidC/Oxa1 family membrane protein insertase